ncbi:hypothetical protein [Zooshikella harenae]|uniref:Uncharacterized protein n=1 Tax=Zooshikella harenae TaxID=2827238 RepID=A0ABS5ZJR4_9GAMM|nr:hypothetical protein [Zooshikella harenae]MBU2714322.1 hypothetical protein [Zooshikella harenae]
MIELQPFNEDDFSQTQKRTVTEHSTESIGGSKTLVAIGALKLHPGGQLS